jgi:acetyl esterase
MTYATDLNDFSGKTNVLDVDIPFNLNNFSIRIVKPNGSDTLNKLPVVMYFHGGGWILGNKMTHNRVIREISFRANVCVVFVNYTPSPEVHYPVPIEQCYEATKYIVKNAQTYNIDPNNLAVCGDSVGGNLAIALTLLAKQRNEFKILYQVLMYPVTDASMSTKSYVDFADGFWLSKKAMSWYWDAYAPQNSSISRDIPLISPINTTIDELKNLPPALIITDENDVLRDEGEAYAHKLMEAGVDVSSVRYLGTIHDFIMLNVLAKTPTPQNALSLVVMNLKNKLHT